MNEDKLVIELGKYLEKKRYRFGYSLAYVADRMGVSKPLIQKYENRSVAIPFNKLIELCKVYKIPLSKLGDDLEKLGFCYKQK